MTDPIRCPNPACGAVGEAEPGHPGRCRRCGHAFGPAGAPPGGPDRTAAWEGPATITADADADARAAVTGAGELPERFGRYEIRGRLGRGGWGRSTWRMTRSSAGTSP